MVLITSISAFKMHVGLVVLLWFHWWWWWFIWANEDFKLRWISRWKEWRMGRGMQRSCRSNSSPSKDKIPLHRQKARPRLWWIGLKSVITKVVFSGVERVGERHQRNSWGLQSEGLQTFSYTFCQNLLLFMLAISWKCRLCLTDKRS